VKNIRSSISDSVGSQSGYPLKKEWQRVTAAAVVWFGRIPAAVVVGAEVSGSMWMFAATAIAVVPQ
jgi:hypothetical protein